MKATMLLAALALSVSLAAPGHAQTANATSPNSNPGGQNEAPAFPSGGTASGGTTPAGGSKIGAPTQVEQQEQAKSAKDTQICKGC